MKHHGSRFAIYLLAIALLTNTLKPEIQSLLYGQAEPTPKLLKLDGDLVVNGKVVIGQGLVLSADGKDGATIQCSRLQLDGTLDARELSATSARLSGGLQAGGKLTASAADLVGAVTADALHVNNAAISKNLAVGATAYVEDVAIRELRHLVSDLEKHKVRPIGETIDRLIKILRAIERGAAASRDEE